MGTITTALSTAFRDFTVNGVASSGAHEPIKANIRALGPLIEAQIAAAAIAGGDLEEAAAVIAPLADVASDALDALNLAIDEMNGTVTLIIESAVSEATSVAEGFADAAEGFRDEAEGFADGAAASAVTAQSARDAAIAAASDPVAVPVFSTRAALLASSSITASVVGRVWQSPEATFTEAPPSASDQDATTAGGIKLYRNWQTSTETRIITRPGAPTAADSGIAGNVNGTVAYALTFVTADGETEVGSRTSITVSNRQVNLTNVRVSTDRRVIARRIYRSPAGAADQVLGQLVATINDNTTTTFVDNVADASLGGPAPWFNTTGGVLRNDAGGILAAFGDQSTRFGIGSGGAGLAGYANTSFGAYSLEQITDGYRNSAFGLYALQRVTTGNANTAMGVHAGEFTTTGSGNVSIGYACFDRNVTGSENTTIGTFAGRQAAGSRNSFFGHTAGQQRASGDNNNGFGFQALRGSALSTGTGNNAFGRGAGAASTTGNFNVFFGDVAGNAATTGSSNTIVGGNAGTALTTGANNLFLGAFAGNRATTQNNLLFIDTISRADFAAAQSLSLVYGVFGASRAAQQFHTNGLHYANAGVALPRRAVTADTTLAADDHTLIVTGTATVTVTLPNAANFPGKIFHIVNRAAFTVVSAGSNVIPIAGGAAGTAILPATAGTWAQLQSNGTTWDIIAS